MTTVHNPYEQQAFVWEEGYTAGYDAGLECGRIDADQPLTRAKVVAWLQNEHDWIEETEDTTEYRITVQLERIEACIEALGWDR